jgi:hypothetical protein
MGALALGVAAWAGACSTTETINFSDGHENDCVAGGCAQGTSSSSSTSSASSASSSGMCVVNQSCAVKWGADVFTGIFETDSAGCTKTGLCHGDGKGNLTLETGKPHEAYVALAAWDIVKAPQIGKKLIVPCDTAGSGMLCNLKVDDGDGGTTNSYGECGVAMPALGSLTPDQLTKIADWIACGAPEN